MKGFFLVLEVLFICGCASLPAQQGVVFQNAPIDALTAGCYDGTLSIGKLRSHGDFGIGTVDRLDGEMLALDNKFYQVKSDGKVYELSDTDKTPFAVVTFFLPKQKISLDKQMDYRELTDYLDGLLISRNIFYAVKIEGRFETIKVRSVLRQDKPYPPLSEAIKNQKVFDYSGIEGTLVGFKFPEYIGGINVADWHFHFISRDKRSGGHLLGLRTRSCAIEIEPLDKIFMQLPDSREFLEYKSSSDKPKD